MKLVCVFWRRGGGVYGGVMEQSKPDSINSPLSPDGNAMFIAFCIHCFMLALVFLSFRRQGGGEMTIIMHYVLGLVRAEL